MVTTLSEPKDKTPQKRSKPKARLLLVDDNQELSRVLTAHLHREGYDVATAKDGEGGLQAARKQKPDLIILDVVMPRMDGMELLKTLRQESQVPVLLLTGKPGDLNQVLGFKLGADDYVGKPFCVEALTERVGAILKRAAAQNPEKGAIKLGKIQMDPERREVAVDGNVIQLTIKEFDLLKALIDARGKVLSREVLLSSVWGIGEDVEIRTRTVDQHIAGIRQKLTSEGERILTVPHFGYRIKMA